MKKGITTEWNFDPSGNAFLIVRKAKGKLTLEDIREAAMEAEQDYYGLVMKCMDDDMCQYYEDDLDGDVAELYPMERVLEAFKRVKMV